jgi:hypothetical protein
MGEGNPAGDGGVFVCSAVAVGSEPRAVEQFYEGGVMRKTIVAISLGAALALAPLVVPAQAAAPAGASTAQMKPHHPTRSRAREMRHRQNLSKERARAGAEHMRNMRKSHSP